MKHAASGGRAIDLCIGAKFVFHVCAASEVRAAKEIKQPAPAINKTTGRYSNDSMPVATIHDASPFILVDITVPQTPPLPSRVQPPRRDWNPATSASRC